MSATLSPFLATLYVAFGGAIGAVGRYLIGQALQNIFGADGFPWPLLAVNTLGSLAMGLLFGWLASHDGGSETQRLLLGVGMLGGFTTFSAFSLEIILLLQRGAIGAAALFISASVVAGVVALLLGLIVMKGAA